MWWLMCDHTSVYVRNYVRILCDHTPVHVRNYDDDILVQPMAVRVAQNFEIISKTFSTNHDSAHGIYG